MLGSHAVEIGPANLPVWVLLCAGAVIALLVVEHLCFRIDRAQWRAVNDLYTTAVAVAFIVWKLTPLATRFAEVTGDLRMLAYAPGGMVGAAAGASVGLALTVPRFVRLMKRTSHSDRGKAVRYAALPVVVIGLALTAGRVIPAPLGGLAPPPTATVQLITGAGMDVPSGDVPTIVVFWATWCAPCAGQMPELQRLYERYGDRAAIVAVNMTDTEPSIDAVVAYIARAAYTFPVALDRGGVLAAGYQVRATPTTLVFDRTGRLRHRRTGAAASSWMAARLLPFVE